MPAVPIVLATRVMRPLLAALLLCAVLPLAAQGVGASAQADPASDAPESRSTGQHPLRLAPTYRDTLALWQSADDVNAWIGHRFQYDRERALALSETQRQRNGRLPIHAPEAFFGTPLGVCVDLARFAVDTLRVVDPSARPRYLMIEFDPVTLSGQTLRRHWVALFERDGKQYVFADSKRPGHIAGPYANVQDYIEDYARYRGRNIVAHREADSYERRLRTAAGRQTSDARP